MTPGNHAQVARRSIFFYPDRPQYWALVETLRRKARWALANRPEDADWCIFFRNETIIDLPADDPYAAASLEWINGRSRDIAKHTVHRIFAELAGYELAVDPATHAGPIVQKSDRNYGKDAVILQGPIADFVPQDGMVYERLVDTRTEDGRIRDLRVNLIGRDIPFVNVYYGDPWIEDGVFANKYGEMEIRATNAVFSAAEQQLILAVAERMGVQIAAIDVLRDNHDGRIYVVDVNNTPSSARQRYGPLRKMHLEMCLDAFKRAFPPARPAIRSKSEG